MEDEINLYKLSPLQKKKLTQFYNVDSIDDLEVLADGSIVTKKKKMTGGQKPSRVYIEDHDGKLHELSIAEFVSKQKDPSLGYRDISPEKATEELNEYIHHLVSNMKMKKGQLHQICNEHDQKGRPDLLLFQQFFIYYANKLKKVLCNDDINAKYIKATGNPGYSDVDYYNMIKKSDDELVIKGFAFCGYPTKQELYVNLICGTGGTGALVHSMLQSIDNKDLQAKPKYIGLDSIETELALEFYTKMGFRKPKPDTVAVINDMIKSKAKTFKEYVNAKSSKVGGKLYLFPHNPEGEKMLKKLKCEWIYSPSVWFETIKQLKKEKKPVKYIREHMIETMKTSKLEGDGIGDFFKSVYNKGKAAVTSVTSRFKPKLNDFTNQSKRTLAKYGDWTIVRLIIQHSPIMGILDKFFNVLTFGKFQELKKKYGYDRLFHLQLGVVVEKDGETKKLTLEKNETIDITEEPASGVSKSTESQNVPISQGKNITLRQLVDDTRQRLGDYTFFSYDAWKNNCQFFIRYLLETLDLYGDAEASFLFQDLSEFQKELPKWLPGFSRGITDLGATVANIRGKGRGRKRKAPGDFDLKR